MSISALVVAIATCAFAFLMYRRISQRLDGLSMAHLTLSRTLQHMVSASMPQQSAQPPSSALGTDSDELPETDQKSIVLNEELGVRRIPVSDDETSQDSSDNSDDEDNDDDSDESESGSDTEGSQANTRILRNLNIMETIGSVDHEDDTLVALELVASENEEESNVSVGRGESRIVEMDNESNASEEEESDLELDEDDGNGSEDESGHKDVTTEVANDSSEQNANVNETDEIVAFSNASHNHHQTDLKLQKVETLRKMALEQNLGDEDSIRKMKKQQLMSMLSG